MIHKIHVSHNSYAHGAVLARTYYLQSYFCNITADLLASDAW